MSNRDKLKIALAGLSNHNSGISDAFKTVEKEMQRVADKIREEAQSKTLDDVKKMTAGFKQQIKEGLDSLMASLDSLKSELGASEKQLVSSLEAKLNLLRSTVAESRNSFGTRYNDLSKEIENLKVDIKEISTRKVQIPDFTSQINKLELGLRKEIDALKVEEVKEDDGFQEKLDKFEKELKEIRIRTLSALASHGGQANRNILVGSNPSTLSRYTDLNIKAGSNVTLTYTNNVNLKTTDLTIAATGGSGGTVRSIASTNVSSVVGALSGTDYVVIAGQGVQITLPTAANNSNLYTIKNVSTSSVLLSPNGLETIDDSSNLILNLQYTSVDLISDNTNWKIT